MRIISNIFTFGIIVSLGLLGGCSDDEPFATPSENAPTGIADANSFSLARLPVNVEGLNFNGVEIDVTARVADRHNHPVPDGTVINLLTNGGQIPPTCTITDGVCTVKWTSQNPRPGANGNPGSPGIVVVLAYTVGEESFNDLNDNDNFDTGETIADISEPFMDHNRNGIRDSNEEFVDFDNDNTFDAPDGLYTGTSCVGDNTVCNRNNLFVWDDTTILITGIPANFTFNPAAPSVAADGSIPITVTITDVNNNPLANDTVVDFTATGGTLDPTSITVVGSQSVFSTIYTAPNAAGAEVLTVNVTSPVSGAVTPTAVGITVTP